MPGRDPAHWLHRLTADEWLRAAMRELGIAREAFARHQSRPALASARRAAGMAWNAVLALEPARVPEPSAALDPAAADQAEDAFGRSYADHLRALAGGAVTRDGVEIPQAVRDAAKRLMDDPAAGPQTVVQLVTPGRDARLIDAAETVLAEAYVRLARRDKRDRT